MKANWIKFPENKPEIGIAVLVYLKRSGVITVAYLKEESGKVFWQLYGPIQDITELQHDEISHYEYLPKGPFE